MGMNKVKGNMYDWVTHTWNPIRGKCPHECSYCYMKRFKVGELRLEEKELKTNLGAENMIFVGSSTDMWADKVPRKWIIEVLECCNSYPYNTYLFQTKNPKRFKEFIDYINFPQNVVLGTTLETSFSVFNLSKAPQPLDRAWALADIKTKDKMVSIEPIMSFNFSELLVMIQDIKPKFVSIGADSQGHGLPEPDPEKLGFLIDELKKFTEVRIKSNMKRLLEHKKNI